MTTLLRLLLPAALLLLGIAPAAAQTPRIVAVGDLHGDFTAWRAIARAAGLIDAAGHWSGGATILVQTGDVPDRGPDSLDIVDDLMRLQEEAKRAGGRVIALVGNHEAMNVTDDLRYVSAGDYAAFATPRSPAVREAAFQTNRGMIEASYRKRDLRMSADAIKQAWLAATPLGQVEHQQAWHPTGRIGRWVARNPAVALIDGTLFVHGGLSVAYASRSLDAINRAVDRALAAKDDSAGSILYDPAGPLWYRGYALPPNARTADGETSAAPGDLGRVLQAYRARRMVIAHTPNLAGIVVNGDGTLARIDTGISSAYGGKLSYLEIIDGRFVPHDLDRGLQKGAGRWGGNNGFARRRRWPRARRRRCRRRTGRRPCSRARRRCSWRSRASCPAPTIIPPRRCPRR